MKCINLGDVQDISISDDISTIIKLLCVQNYV